MTRRKAFQGAPKGAPLQNTAEWLCYPHMDGLWDVNDLVALWEQYERRAERAA